MDVFLQAVVAARANKSNELDARAGQ